MKNLLKLALFCMLLLQYEWASAWGTTGHRVIAEIAENHLNKKAKKNIQKIIGNQKLAYWSNWADFIKSDPDPALNSTGSSHFINTAANLSFDDFTLALTNSPANNLYKSYLRIKENAKQKNHPLKEQQQDLYFIIHLLADAHQPMHVSRAEDLGGNKINVDFFGKKGNIHRVWDSDLVDNEKYSYTEYARVLDIYDASTYKNYASTNFEQWLFESHQLANVIYADVAQNTDLRYEYIYQFKYKMEECLLKGGIRLAKELNEIYGY
ncbi:S1/P1 nuclease [Sphingobacterium sp. LRF_L2]|uniref:S1/P1 nuclease n=1 Tax=Sphingobacterium sp. LRF_L2 TaxID=3369421 RepID=UPI003F6269C5